MSRNANGDVVSDKSQQCTYEDKRHVFEITGNTKISWYGAGQHHSLCLRQLSDDMDIWCENQDDVYIDMILKERHILESDLSAHIGKSFYVTIVDDLSGGNFQLDNLKIMSGMFTIFIR